MAKDDDIPKLDVSDEMIAERRGDPGEPPEDMVPWARAIVASVETVNLWSGRVFCWMLAPLMLAMVYEVVVRKVFVAPTDWAYDVSRMVCGAMFMVGAGYALLRGVHIRADFLYRNWSPRTRDLVDSTLYVIFYFPALIFFFWISFEYAQAAWTRGERSMDTAWMAPVGPVRTAMPLGALLLILQGMSELLRCMHGLKESERRFFTPFVPLYGFFAVIFIPMCLALVLQGIAWLAPPLGFLGPDWLVNVLGSPNHIADFLLGGASETVDLMKGMGGLSPETIGFVMIAVMLFAIFVGFPISFTLIFLGIAFGALGFGSKLVFYLMTLQFNNVMLEQTLAAVPLFVFMGILMEQAGLMERLFRAVQLMLASTKGALYIAVLFVSTIFAAATGIVGASVTILGIMAAKTMNRSGYDVKLAAGTITAGGTLGILIPPSIMLVVMGPVLEVPVTDLFAAAIIPGVMLATLYTVYALVRCWIDPELGPPLPKKDRPNDYGVVAREFFLGLVPPSALVGFALGSILFGWATPTEGAGCGAFGALLLTLAYRKMTVARFQEALVKTLEISVLILFLVAASNFFGAVFSRLGTPTMLTEYLLSIDLPQIAILLIIMALIFILGWPLEWVPIVLIIVPILIPALEKLDVNLTWFGILVAVNLQTAWLSPPVALSAYFLKGVVPEWDLKDIYLGMMQFMVIQLIGLLLIIVFPQIALWLPQYIYGN